METGADRAERPFALLDRVAWPIAALVWLYEAYHSADHLGMNTRAVWQGPHDLLRGIALYPDVSTWHSTTTHAYYVFPPASAILLSPLGLGPKDVTGSLFILLSVAVFMYGLYRLARKTSYPGLIMLAAGLSLPVTSELSAGDADLIVAGLIALALDSKGRTRALYAFLAFGIKPTAWYVFIALGWPGLIGGIGALLLNVVGFAIIRDPGRFFHHVIPWLTHGQQGVDAIRASIPDIATAYGASHSPVADVTQALLVVSLVAIAIRLRGSAERERAAPLLIALGLILSSYCFVQYLVYLVAVLPLLRPRRQDLVLLGVSLYLIGVRQVWSSSGLPHDVNVLADYKVLLGLLLLVPVAARPLLPDSLPLRELILPRRRQPQAT